MDTALQRLSQQEQLNFLLTNRIPRHALTRLAGWFSRIENRHLTRLAIAIWQRFADDLRLEDALEQDFLSLRDCFTRQLKPGLRPIDSGSDIVCSPCDAIIGACGPIAGQTVFQAKGFPYELADLIPDAPLRKELENGVFVTLRLKSSMYHRFHAPVDCQLREVQYISGDTWNVNPIALQRIEKLYCRNERAVLKLEQAATGGRLCLVPVAAILVASMRFHALGQDLDLNYKGPHHLACDADYSKGDELGYFQHGSTILLFASAGYRLLDGLQTGYAIRMGEALLHAPDSSTNR